MNTTLSLLKILTLRNVAISVYFFILLFVLFLFSIKPAVAKEKNIKLKEVVVVAPKAEIKSTITKRVPTLTSKSKVTAKEIETFNAVNIEDTVRYLPNLFVRKRFIGDPNGVFSIRGNSNFQTARHMVFVDGFPLHNLLQSID